MFRFCRRPWGTLHALTKLPSDEFERRIADGSIRPDLERKEIKAWKPVTKVQAAYPQTEDAAPLMLSDRVEVVTKQRQPTDQDSLAVGNEESTRAGLEPVTPTLPTLDAYLEAIDRLGETACTDDEFVERSALIAKDEDALVAKIVDLVARATTQWSPELRVRAHIEIATKALGVDSYEMGLPLKECRGGRSPTLDPRAWSLSTPHDREAFVKEVGTPDIEAVINAVEPSRALRRFESIEQAWNGATDSERLAFARKHYDEIETLGWQQRW